MALKIDAKFEGKLACASKNYIKTLTTFTRALKSLKIATLIGSFYPKQKMLKLKTYRGVMCHNNEEW